MKKTNKNQNQTPVKSVFKKAYKTGNQKKMVRAICSIQLF